MRGLYLGLDNTQPNLARVVCVTTAVGWNWLPSAHAWTQSRSLLAFQAFWTQEGLRPDALAATTVRQDPFGVIAWLEGQGLHFARYDQVELYHGFDEAGDPDELPPRYRRAYSLALRAAFQSEAPSVAIELSSSLHCLQERMFEMQRILKRLVDVIPF